MDEPTSLPAEGIAATPIPATNGPVAPAPAKVLRDRKGRVYEPAVGPRLRILLYIIFAAVAVLGATGVYLLSIRLLEWARGQAYETMFSQWMFLAHIFLGVVIVLPFLIFGFVHLTTA